MQSKSGKTDLCPVILWVKIIKRLWSYPGSSLSTQVNTVHLTISRSTFLIRNTQVISALRHANDLCGNTGVPSLFIGTHSVRTSFAMLLHLMGIPDSTIQKKGRWKSSAFLRYIRTYVDQFGGNSSEMLANQTQHFRTIFIDPTKKK